MLNHVVTPVARSTHLHVAISKFRALGSERAIGLRDIFMKGHWSVEEASWPCEELDWDAMEAYQNNQLLYSV